MKASRVIICPSDAMVKTLLHRYPFLYSKVFITIPNLADGCRPSVREYSLWGFENPPHFSLGYMGGLSPWQCFEETCKIVLEVQKQLSDTWFLVLTQQKENAEAILTGIGVKQYRICSTSTEKAPRYTASFDLGFMLRRQHIVNWVACPMKWLEYWQSNVPVVTTRAVEIVSGAPGADLNCIVDVDDIHGAAKNIIAWASSTEDERNKNRTQVACVVQDNWTWGLGKIAIEDVLTAVETNLSHCRYMWIDRIRANLT